LAALFAVVGVGTAGGAANCFAPWITSAPARCTTTASAARLATAASTYCFDTSPFAAPVPGVVRTAAIVAGEVVGTDQYSRRTVPSSSWKTTV
jgi:hypothetical protein